jgi:hypothetical protein
VASTVLTYAFDLWKRAFNEVGQADYADIKRDYAHVDATCTWMVTKPEWFDVIITDLGAMIQGGILRLARCEPRRLLLSRRDSVSMPLPTKREGSHHGGERHRCVTVPARASDGAGRRPGRRRDRVALRTPRAGGRV